MLSPAYLRVFGESLWLSVLTTGFTLLLGYPFAYFTAQLSPKRRSLALLLVIVPFWTNSLVRIYGWMILLRSQGVVNALLIALGVIDTPLKLLYNFGAVLVGMVYALLPFMILSVYNSISKLDPVAHRSGARFGRGQVARLLERHRADDPGGHHGRCVLVFIPSVGLFFISDLLGGAKTMLLGNLIKNELLTARNWPMGAALSVVMMAATLLVSASTRSCRVKRVWRGSYEAAGPKIP